MSDSRRSADELSVAAALLCLALAPVLSGCGSTLTEQSGGGVSGLPEWKPFRYTSPAPGVPWRIKPDTADAIPGERQPGVPAALQPVASSLTLPQLLAVALDNTPATRQAWEQARSAAAAWGAARGEYYPAATIGAQGLVSRGSSSASTSTAVVVGVGSREQVVAGLANHHAELPAPGLRRPPGSRGQRGAGARRRQLEPQPGHPGRREKRGARLSRLRRGEVAGRRVAGHPRRGADEPRGGRGPPPLGRRHRRRPVPGPVQRGAGAPGPRARRGQCRHGPGRARHLRRMAREYSRSTWPRWTTCPWTSSTGASTT